MGLGLGILLLVAAIGWGIARRGGDAAPGPRPAAGVKATASRLYTRRNFLKACGATAGAAALAYSGADELFEEWHTRDVRSPATDRLAHLAKEFGENEWVAIWLAMAGVDVLLPSTPLSRYGRRCFEATAVGLPALWTWQRVLGASRPTDEKPYGSRFRPLTDENSVSGHTFIGAVPFLTAARAFGAPAPKTVAYFLSPWTGWSRLNDRKHYLSQVLLGYGLAWESVAAAEQLNAPE